MSKIGRNDPCWCGSGKKYKHCHLRLEQPQHEDLIQQERAFPRLYNKLMELARDVRGEGDFTAAYQLYWNNRMDFATPEKLSREHLFEFFEFYVFDYLTARDDKPIIDLVAERRRGQLSPVERKLLDRWHGSYRSLYQIVQIDGSPHPQPLSQRERGAGGERGATLRDMLQGDQVAINDQLPSELTVGQALVGRVLPAGDRRHLTRAVTAVSPELVDPMLVYMQHQFQLYQERWYGRTWPDFLRERSYLFNYFLLEQIAPEPIARPETGRDAEIVRDIVRELQTGIIVGPLDQHYARWAEKPIAAWGNRSPRQMMKTERGRERVEAVLDALEAAERVKRASGQPFYNVDRLRALLGFEQPQPVGGGRLVG
jgi:hypothetical protein